jgi:hypothetical protein
MSRQVLFTMVACLLAGSVLAATVLLSPNITGPNDEDLPKPGSGQGGTFSPLNKDSKGGNLDDLGKGDFATSGTIQKIYIRRIDPKRKRITIFSADEARPRANGVSDVVNPRALLHLVPGKRVLEILGDEGQLVAPDKNPEKGFLKGNVVLSLYDAPEGKNVIIGPDSPHTQLRVFLDEPVHFNLIIGLVDSDGPVHLSTPRVDFQGTGLNLAFNETKRRINRLEIIKGKSLRFNPNALKKEKEKEKENDKAKENTAATDSKKTDQLAKDGNAKSDANEGPPTGNQENTAEKAIAKDKVPEAPDYYKATFEKAVLISSPEAEIVASQLQVLFSFGEKRDGDEAFEKLSAADRVDYLRTLADASRQTAVDRAIWATRRVGSAYGGTSLSREFSAPHPLMLTSVSTAQSTAASSSESQSAGESNAPSSHPSLARKSKDDVTIKWTGSMMVEPFEKKPDMLVDAEDSLIRLAGPVEINTTGKERVVAHYVDYQTTPQLVRMLGSDATPLVIQSRKLGQLTAPQVIVNQSTGKGKIIGAGAIIANEKAVAADAIKDAAAPGKQGEAKPDAATKLAALKKKNDGLPQGLAVRWTQDVDLTFYLDEKKDAAKTKETELAKAGKPTNAGKAAKSGGVIKPGDAAKSGVADKSGKVKIKPTSNLDALKTAIFRGLVKVDHPQFALKSDQMEVNLPPRAKKANKPASSKAKSDTKSPPKASGIADAFAGGPGKSNVHATGSVVASVRGNDDQETIGIEAEDLDITFLTDKAGTAKPTHIHAERNVKTNRNGQTLKAGLLDVSLASVERADKKTGVKQAVKPDAKPDSKSTKKESLRLTMTKMFAKDDVRIDGKSPQTLVRCERLEADMLSGKVRLFGTDEVHARVQREDNRLSGPIIIMHDKDQIVQVLGPGEAAFVTKTGTSLVASADASDKPNTTNTAKPAPVVVAAVPIKPEAKPKAKKTKEPQFMQIKWAQNMRFNNRTGQGRFMGEVVASAVRSLDITRFQADELLLQMSPDLSKDGSGLKDILNSNDNKRDKAGKKTSSVKDAAGEVGGNGAKANAGASVDVKPNTKPNTKPDPNSNKKVPVKEKPAPKRVVQRLDARGSVIFESEKWEDTVGGKLASRFRLRGPELIFDRETEQIKVIGKGSMLIEDYKEKRKASKKGKKPPADSVVKPKPAVKKKSKAAVAFVGKGMTLFDWQKGMTIDAGRNDVRIEKDVQLIQLAAGEQDPVQMDCQQLYADFASTGGLDAWLSGKAPEPALDNIIAVESVRLIRKTQTLRADRLEYVGKKNLVVLSSLLTKFCYLEQPKSILPAKRFRWHLDTDKIIAEEPGAVRARVVE